MSRTIRRTSGYQWWKLNRYLHLSDNYTEWHMYRRWRDFHPKGWNTDVWCGSGYQKYQKEMNVKIRRANERVSLSKIKKGDYDTDFVNEKKYRGLYLWAD